MYVSELATVNILEMDMMVPELLTVAGKLSVMLTLSGPKRWEPDKIVSLLHIKFIIRSGKG